jgi:hypothetical protein
MPPTPVRDALRSGGVRRSVGRRNQSRSNGHAAPPFEVEAGGGQHQPECPHMLREKRKPDCEPFFRPRRGVTPCASVAPGKQRVKHVRQRRATGIVEWFDNAPQPMWKFALQITLAPLEPTSHMPELHHVARRRDPHRQGHLLAPRFEPRVRLRKIRRLFGCSTRPTAIAEHKPRNLLIIARRDRLAQFALAIVAHCVKLRGKPLGAFGARDKIAIAVTIDARRRV